MKKFEYINVFYGKDQQLLIWEFKSDRIPLLSLGFLKEVKVFSKWVKEHFNKKDNPLKYIVSASDYEGLYNVGGDLQFLIDNIKSENKHELRKYAYLCVNMIQEIYSSFGTGAISIALIEGNAYGGGFECAIAHDFIIAKNKLKFCLPDYKFNPFPIMRSNVILKECVDYAENSTLEEKMIYKSKKLFDIGLIEEVVKNNQTIFSLNNFIAYLDCKFNQERTRIKYQKEYSESINTNTFEKINAWINRCLSISNLEIHKMEIINNAKYRRVKMDKNLIKNFI